MALFPKTPGVYVQEISTLPSSVVPVPTAIPVFIGYTQTALIDGVQWAYPLGAPTNPIRIESMLQFQSIFGNAYSETFNATLTTSNVDIAVSRTTGSAFANFRLFYNMQMYFGNGGGPCYVISVGDYSSGVVASGFSAANIAKAEQIDEITLVVIPEAMASNITDGQRLTIYNDMLAHCAKMQDRFSLLDVKVVSSNTIKQDSDTFRNLNVGANNLSYGAAYYPSFDSALSFSYADSAIAIVATDLRLPASVLAFQGKFLSTVNTGIFSSGTITATFPVTGNVVIDGESISLNQPTQDIVDDINANTVLSPRFTAVKTSNTVITITAVTASSDSPVTFTSTAGTRVPNTGFLSAGLSPDKALYNRITAALTAEPLELYPSSTMAGIYAAVDNDRGVWKAPANVGVTLVDSLNRTISDEDQSGLNVDAMSGKSIDAIRNFEGRGMLVWGARTLDGNSNDFRYVNVRRTLIFIEDSCKHASEFVVFEPNDKNTWIRVKGMISNFLTNLWRQGGLVGDKPEQAFFVKIGLGETMTAQDILEGKLIVTIGVAISHPAEFVILNFMHKLQEA